MLHVCTYSREHIPPGLMNGGSKVLRTRRTASRRAIKIHPADTREVEGCMNIAHLHTTPYYTTVQTAISVPYTHPLLLDPLLLEMICWRALVSVTAFSVLLSNFTGEKCLGAAAGQGHTTRSQTQQAARVRKGNDINVQYVSCGTSGHSLTVSSNVSAMFSIVAWCVSAASSMKSSTLCLPDDHGVALRFDSLLVDGNQRYQVSSIKHSSKQSTAIC